MPVKKGENIFQGPDGIVIEILQTRKAIIQVPRFLIEEEQSRWRKQDLGLILGDLLQPLGFIPKHPFETVYDVAKRSWIVHVEVNPIGEIGDTAV